MTLLLIRIRILILDGGALLFCLVDLLLQRPVSTRVQDLANEADYATLATMFLLTTTVRDLDGVGLLRCLGGHP